MFRIKSNKNKLKTQILFSEENKKEKYPKTPLNVLKIYNSRLLCRLSPTHVPQFRHSNIFNIYLFHL